MSGKNINALIMSSLAIGLVSHFSIPSSWTSAPSLSLKELDARIDIRSSLQGYGI